ncbi:Aromatic/aminoadipate aminotransferase 1 [Candida viswanathii]|jgi:aromatic amino acid aminotransferase I|uniref:aromatic-amino-acid transaminase n=1 Tax=Candida viswanathii TaxID=5486 RepID=A0A367XMY3_9ASCO|nr:Aromatic/aminoadipate aminotransferase 1 [Candida viswanathii]
MTTSSKPKAKNLNHLLSGEAKSRQLSPLKGLFKYFNTDVAYLAGGLPMSDYFPFEKLAVDIPTPSFPGGIGAPITVENKTTVEVYKNKADNVPDQIELARALQYGSTEGSVEFILFVKEHVEMIHKVPYEDWDTIASVGNTESWDSTLRTFCSKGDSILVEEYSFSSALETANGQGINTVPVTMDEFGLIPEKLDELMSRWVGNKPKLLYTICTGQNPTGSCLSAERRKKIYELACKYDFLVVEDEPYYFLQMEPYTKDKAAREGKAVHSHEEFINALVPSFVSLDVEGRVIRLDSVSKVLAPGLRLGFIVGQKVLLERYVRLHEVSVQNPSGFSETLTNALLRKWGHSGYLEWLIALRKEYTYKRDVALDAVEELLPKEVTTFQPPVAGMFFCLTLDATKHPKYKEFGEDPLKVEEAIHEQAIKQGCLMAPGSWFKSEGQSNPPQTNLPLNPNHRTHIFFRGTYAAVPLDRLVDGIKKFGKAVRIEYGLE